MNERIINLIGLANFKKIQDLKILLVGVGGVGSFAFEGLVRMGVENITIIDHDQVELTNLNRQLVANLKTIGMDKVDVAKEIAQNINKSCHITALKEFLSESNITILSKDFDFIIDACDTLDTKVALIKFATRNNIKIICAMGMGNRTEGSKIKVSRLDKTENDPLAKKLRKLLREEEITLKIPVVWSEELPKQKKEVNSLITSPGISGLLIVDYIVNETIKVSK